MADEELIFTIAADGKTVEITAAGFKGTACKDAMEPFERALGVTTSDTPTADMTATAKKVTHVDKSADARRRK